MTKQEFKEKCKCPLCKMGFHLMCSMETKKKGWFKKSESNLKVEHLDILWSNESGLTAKCEDEELIKQFIVKNEKYGTGYSLNEEITKIFEELSDDFYEDPSYFSKDNTDLNSFSIIMGSFFRYSDYMDNRELRKDIDDHNKIATEMYNSGKNLKEIMDTITEIKIEEEIIN